MTLRDTKDVLIIDDEETIRGMMVAALARLGISCDTAVDGVDALERVSVTHYSVVLVDLMMPRLDGAAFVTALRERERASGDRPVVLMMTAFPIDDRLPEVGENIQAVIQKPFDVLEVAELVHDCVKESRAHDSVAPARPRGVAGRAVARPT